MRELPVSLLLAALVAGKLIFLFLCWLVWRTYRRGFGGGQSRMIGLFGKAVTDVEREGRVMIQGEYWWARARTPITAGERVRVMGINGMQVEVESCPEKAALPRSISVVPAADQEVC